MAANTDVQSRRRNFHLIINDSDNVKTPGPIIGYAQEPLLPLADACTPLTDIVHDISKYVSIALEHTPNHPADGLTRDESASIRLYTMEWPDTHRSLYYILNSTLKTADRKDLQPWFKYLKLFLTAIAKLPSVPPLTAWLGVRTKISDGYSPGARVIWWTFSSWTIDLPILENDCYMGSKGERTLFSGEIFNGRNIHAHSHFNNKDEILMLPGTYMEVTSNTCPSPELQFIGLKQMIPEDISLEPPFKDAALFPRDKSNTSQETIKDLLTKTKDTLSFWKKH